MHTVRAEQRSAFLKRPLGHVCAQDNKLAWFDLDLSTKPYRSLRYHGQAVRGVAFHARHPLFASASDDGAAHVFHGMVYQARPPSHALQRCMHALSFCRLLLTSLCCWGTLTSLVSVLAPLVYLDTPARHALQHVGCFLQCCMCQSFTECCARSGGTGIFAHAQDLLTNPLIVPVKILRGHERVNHEGVLAVAFHPSQPWLFTAGADATICLFTH
jgi:WD40 repeat protein